MKNSELLAAIADAINDSTDTIKVCVPDSDFYARAGSYTTEHLDVINPGRLAKRLNALAEEAETSTDG